MVAFAGKLVKKIQMIYNHHMKQLSSDEILQTIRAFNRKYEKAGIRLMGVFGSYARDEATDFSDIDIAYRIDHTKFYPDNAFKKLEAIQEIREKLERAFKRKVDLVPYPKEDSPLKERLKKEMLVA